MTEMDMKMVKINISHKEIQKRKALLDDWSRFENKRIPVWLFVDQPFLCRVDHILMRDIYRDPLALVRSQINGWKYVLENVDCDNDSVPVSIYFGTCLVASSYGCQVIIQDHSEAAAEIWFKDENDLARLEKIDTFAEGLKPKEIEYYHILKKKQDTLGYQFEGGDPVFPLRDISLSAHSDGPFSIACMIAGFDTVCLWCYEKPDLVKAMLEIITAKEIDRIRRTYELMGREIKEIFLADDYSPYLSLAMYEEFVLPYQLRFLNALSRKVLFHSCIMDKKLLTHWRDDLEIRLFNGFKPRETLKDIISTYTPVKDCMGGKVLLEPDLNGAHFLIAQETQVDQAARDFHQVFNGVKGVKLGVTLSGGHPLDDIQKMNRFKITISSLK